MDTLLKLAKTYRVTTDLPSRLHLGDQIFALIQPELRAFVFSSVIVPAAHDVLQETLKGIATGLDRYTGNSEGQFWAWCYAIARNKLADHFRKSGSDHIQPLPPDEVWQLIDRTEAAATMSAADRHDLETVLQMLDASNPECREYLWQHYVMGVDYGEIAAETGGSYDSVRMRISRCMDEAQTLVA